MALSNSKIMDLDLRRVISQCASIVLPSYVLPKVPKEKGSVPKLFRWKNSSNSKTTNESPSFVTRESLLVLSEQKSVSPEVWRKQFMSDALDGKLYHEGTSIAQTIETAFDDVLSRMTYKPNTTFAREHDYLRISIKVPHRDRPRETVTVEGKHLIPYVFLVDIRNERPTYDLVQRIADWIRHQILDLEIHEFNEWVRFDGELMHDPHKGGK